MTAEQSILSNSTKNCNYNLVVCMLASGSKGNAIFISNGSTSILVDAGLSGIEIERRLKSRELNPEDLDAILVSHEHSDHIQGVGVLSRRFDLPVYINSKTIKAASSQLKNIKNIRSFECGSAFMLKTLALHPFSISHDAEDPAGFTIKQNGSKIGIATDLGIVTSMVKQHLKECSLLILEANHDQTMLANGPYPWPLKQRIKSRTGHLSNEDSKNLLNEIKHNKLEYLILAHLSETNNTPEKALSVAGQALTNIDTRMSVASQYESGVLLYVK
jgi:phosphoribosyl 1,2-cyclic phosphodiesterase